MRQRPEDRVCRAVRGDQRKETRILRAQLDGSRRLYLGQPKARERPEASRLRVRRPLKPRAPAHRSHPRSKTARTSRDPRYRFPARYALFASSHPSHLRSSGTWLQSSLQPRLCAGFVPTDRAESGAPPVPKVHVALVELPTLSGVNKSSLPLAPARLSPRFPGCWCTPIVCTCHGARREVGSGQGKDKRV